jgi:hypothetical protein
MTETATKKSKGRPVKEKKAETKEKVSKLLEGLPINKTTKSTTETKIIEKPQPKDNEFDFILEQLDAANLKIKELEDKLVHYKSSYEKAVGQGKTNLGADGVTSEIKLKMTNMFNEMVFHYNKQKRGGIQHPVAILDYSGSGPQGMLQQLMAIFPFLKQK